jgi:hypothetical protein
MLYERFVLNELDANEYKAEKDVLDREISQMICNSETPDNGSAALPVPDVNDIGLRSLADKVLAEDKLTRPLVDMIINKVYIYPRDRVEIEWKAIGFAKAIVANGGSENVG